MYPLYFFTLKDILDLLFQHYHPATDLAEQHGAHFCVSLHNSSKNKQEKFKKVKENYN